MGSGVSKKRVGTTIGTGLAIDVKIPGFRPKVVKLYNVSGGVNAVWTKTMADASMHKQVDGGSGIFDMSFVTTNGITPLADGFKIGADSDLNASGEVIHWAAFE